MVLHILSIKNEQLAMFLFNKPLVSFSTVFCFVLASCYVFCEHKAISHAVKLNVFKTQIMIQNGGVEI